MILFTLFVLTCTVVASLLFTAASVTFSNFLLHVFRLDFGDFQLEHYSDLDRAICLLAVLIVVLVFLYMLITIMGDTSTE